MLTENFVQAIYLEMKQFVIRGNSTKGYSLPYLLQYFKEFYENFRIYVHFDQLILKAIRFASTIREKFNYTTPLHYAYEKLSL